MTAGVNTSPTTNETKLPNVPAQPNCRTGMNSLTHSETEPIAVVNVAKKQGFTA